MQAGGQIESNFNSNGANGDDETIFLCMVQNANSVYNAYSSNGANVTFPIIGGFGSNPNKALGSTIQGSSNLGFMNGPGALIHIDGMVEWEAETWNKPSPYNIPVFYSDAASCSRPECQIVTAIKNIAENNRVTSATILRNGLNITVPSDNIVTVELLTVSGRLLMSQKNIQLLSGLNTIPMPQNIATGEIILKVVGKGLSYHKQITLP